MRQDTTPVTELGLPESIIKVLQNKGVKNYGTLCCVTMGDLEEWGLKPSEITLVLKLVKI